MRSPGISPNLIPTYTITSCTIHCLLPLPLLSQRSPLSGSSFQVKEEVFINNLLLVMEGENEKMIRHFMSQVKLEDLINVGFMKPVELALKTHATDPTVPNDTLPQGMLIAVKEGSINDNKYKLAPMTEVPRGATMEQVRKAHQDNYVSLLKKPEGVELAICVCMYSEDKKMLKRTLMGIADNIDRLVDDGISPDDIFVCIVIDGIQKVDESLFDYFQEFQRESEIFLEEDDELTMRQKYNNDQVRVDFDDEKEPLNFSKFLFPPDIFQDRFQRKFTNVREKYDEVVRIRTQIQNIRKERNNANQNLKMILNKIIDQQRTALRSMAEDGDLQQDESQFTEETIMKELGSSEEECNQYISSRDALAYVSAYRLPTTSLSTRLANIQAERKEATDGGYDEDVDRQSKQSLMDKRSSNIGSTPQGDSESAGSSINVDRGRRSKKYVNLYFCIKYKNSGKLSSHNWFFNGFCNELKPKYAILLDVGLRCYPQAIYKMYNYMKRHPTVGGVCGYMSLKAEKVEDDEMHKDEDLDCLSSFIVNIFDIQKAQQIEYHFAHLIDKPFESIFKFIHVLPGAFSGYSMAALRPKDSKDALLREYFKSIDEKLASNKVVPSTFTTSDILMRIFLPKVIWRIFKPVDPNSQQQVLYNQNIYLAEDRILCMGIHKNEFDILFMPDAYAEVDPIKTVNGLMGQRKRWINGSMFAFEKVQKEMSQTTSPSMAVKDFFLKMQIFYLNFTLFLVYFAPALMLFTFHLTMQAIKVDYLVDVFAVTNPQSIGAIIYATFVSIMDFLYTLMILAIIFFSIHLTHSNKQYIYFVYLFSTIFGIFSLLTFIIFIVDVIKGFTGADTFIKQEYEQKLNDALPGLGGLIDLLRYFIITSMGLYIFPILLYGLFFLRFKYMWEILSGTFSFLFYSPSYLNLLNIYAMCRIDDISWGTKGLDSSVGGKNAKLKQTWKIVKMIDVAKFAFWNVIIGVMLIVFDSFLLVKFFITLGLLILFTLILAIKMIIGLGYLIKYKCIISKREDKRNEAQNLENVAEDDPLRQKEMHMQIYSVIDSLEESIRNDIKMSFELAAFQYEMNEAVPAQQQQQHPTASNDRAKYNQSIVNGKYVGSGNDHNANANNRVSKANVAFAFGENKFKNLRKENQARKSFYPDTNARKSRAVNKIIAKDETANIEMHLLQRRVEQQAKKEGENPNRQDMSRRYDKIRETFLNRIQSKRFQ